MPRFERQQNRTQNRQLVVPVCPDRLDSQPTSSVHSLLAQQQSLSNQDMQRLLRTRAVQPKRTINEPGAHYEQEADLVADALMRLPTPQLVQGNAASTLASSASMRTGLQRNCACGGTPGPDGECVACRNKRLQRRSDDRLARSAVPTIVHEVLRSPGQPLDPATRSYVEPRFGHDFSHVRVHTDARAVESARAVNALAYTVGHDIVFAAGQYAPGTALGRRLLTHELTHVVQHAKATDVNSIHPTQLSISAPDSPSERVADRVSHALQDGLPHNEAIAPLPSTAAKVTIQRQQPELQTQAERRAQEERNRRVRTSLAERLVQWQAAGLLDPPHRPANVPPIPPFPVTEEEARALRLLPVAGLLGRDVGAAVRQAVVTSAATRAVAAFRPLLPFVGGALGAGITAGLTTFLITGSAEPWIDTFNPITRTVYRDRREYEWVRRLTDSQVEYLRRLDRVTFQPVVPSARPMSSTPVAPSTPASPSAPTPAPVAPPAPVPAPAPAPPPATGTATPPCLHLLASKYDSSYQPLRVSIDDVMSSVCLFWSTIVSGPHERVLLSVAAGGKV
jgi:hypothetical protein